jgi:gliding motility-associated-like protein
MKKIASLSVIGNPMLKQPSTLQICFILFFFISISSFAQGPGCPNVNAGEDVELDCNEPCTDLSATFLQTGETTSYEVTSIPFEPPFPATGGTPVSVNTDDVWSPIIPLPFEFCFFGESYDEMLIGSNGVVTFDLVTNDPGGYCAWSFDESIPDSNLFLNTIFGPYMDIDPSVGGSGQINWTVFGDAPCRTMVVNFPEIPYFSCNSLTMTTQIVMYETTNVVEVYLENRSDQCPNWNDGNAALGIQNQDASVGFVAPGRNTGNWAATEEAWRFTPNGDSNVEFAWLNEADEVIGTDPLINVCPEDPVTTYTARAIYTNCNGDVITETDSVTVTINESFSVELGGDQEFCDVPSYDITAEIINGDPAEATFLWSTGETTQTITVTTTGDYSVEVTIGACVVFESVNMQFGVSPIIDLGEDITMEVCDDVEIVLDAAPLNMDPEDVTYLWNTGETTIIPRSDLEVYVGEDFKSCPNEAHTITAVTDEVDVTFQWYLNEEILTGATNSSLNIPFSEEVPIEEGEYRVVITSGDCVGEDSVYVSLYEVENCIITQGISPNGDGYNDELDLEFLSDRTGISKLQIFNRLGTLVYEKSNYVNEWIGQSDDGNELPTGTYFYVIDLLGNDPVYEGQATGWIYLMKESN